MVPEATLQAVINELRMDVPGLMACYVFGSVAKAIETPDSDLDIAVLLRPGEKIPDFLLLVARLTEIAGRQVDLLDLREAGDFLRMEVFRDGRQLFVADADQVLAWEGEAMSDYQTHLFRIRGILDDFQRTGVGYTPR